MQPINPTQPTNVRVNVYTCAAIALAFLAGSFITARLSDSRSVHAQSPRVFELRIYHTFPGRLPALQTRFREHTIAIFNKHHMTSIGYWVPQDAPQKDNTLVYIIAHESRDAAKKNWADFQADPEWQQVSKASEADGKIVEKVDSTYMDAASYSPLK
jgi:NIPSNAP